MTITGAQIIAARTMLGWTQAQLVASVIESEAFF